jgi:dihydroxyacetone kinase-like predicted kinase
MSEIIITCGEQSHTIDIDKIRITETDCLSFFDWLVNAAEEKHRRVLSSLIKQHTDKNPNKITVEQGHGLLKEIPLESGKERNARMEAEAIQ